MSVPPPSKPDGRISRIRLSGRWFTSERIDRSEPERRGESAPAQPRPPKRPCTPAGVVNMSSKSIAGLRPVALAPMVPGGSARRHSRRCRLLRSAVSPSTFLRSLRSMALTPLHGCRVGGGALATVRRANCTYSFPVCSFHEDSSVPRRQRRN